MDIVKFLVKLGKSAPFSDYVDSQHFPPAEFENDEEIVASVLFACVRPSKR